MQDCQLTTSGILLYSRNHRQPLFPRYNQPDPVLLFRIGITTDPFAAFSGLADHKSGDKSPGSCPD